MRGLASLTGVTGVINQGSRASRADGQEVRRRGRILIVDDEPFILSALRRVLSGEHDVVTASEPKEALACLHDSPPFDLVLCDLLMPGMSGLDLYNEALRRRPGVEHRFVFLTGSIAGQELSGLADLGDPGQQTVRILSKPVDVQHLRELARRCVEGPAPSQEQTAAGGPVQASTGP